MENLFHSTRYKSFITDRDYALEKVLQNTQTDLSRMLYDALENVSGYVSRLTLRSELDAYAVNSLVKHLDTYLSQVIGQLFPVLVNRIKRMRQATFTLTYASEMEAIARGTKKTSHAPRFSYKAAYLRAKDLYTLHDVSLEKRVWHTLFQLQMKIIKAFNLSLIQELSKEELLDKVEAVYPQLRSYKRPPRHLKPVRESDSRESRKPRESLIDLDFIDEADWELAVQAYKDTELPLSRFDNQRIIDPDSTFYGYEWELEQEVTDDFVNQVRNGQIEAANELGIQEFVWVAILDDRTDECCVKRNGHTTEEIQVMLTNGKLNPEVCDAFTPPAHPNCRCQIAPVASVDQVEGPDWQSFGEWLAS